MDHNNNFRLGLFYISTAVICWGLLPIALKLSAEFIDAISLTWLRFLFALVFSFVVQVSLKQTHQFWQLTTKEWIRLFFAGIFLVINYITFVWCLDYLAPAEAQLNFQTAPFYLAIGGFLIFKERISLLQIVLFCTLAGGLLLFFHPLLGSTSIDKQFILGMLFVQLASATWCIYALLQKSLHDRLSPANILLFIFALGVVILFPVSDLSNITQYNHEEWLILLFCSVNTVIAYGCFSQSMKYWKTVQVSAMIALTPVASFGITLLCMSLGLWTDVIYQAPIDFISTLGMLIVIISAAAVQLFNKG